MKDGGGRHACPFESGARPDDAAHYACQRAIWCIIGGVFKRFHLLVPWVFAVMTFSGSLSSTFQL